MNFSSSSLKIHSGQIQKSNNSSTTILYGKRWPLEKDMKEKALCFEKKMRTIQDLYVCKSPLCSANQLETISNHEKNHAYCLIFHIGGLFI